MVLVPEGAAAARDPPTQWATSVQIWLNGEAITIENPDPKTTLLEWLREDRCVRSQLNSASSVAVCGPNPTEFACNVHNTELISVSVRLGALQEHMSVAGRVVAESALYL